MTSVELVNESSVNRNYSRKLQTSTAPTQARSRESAYSQALKVRTQSIGTE